MCPKNGMSCPVVKTLAPRGNAPDVLKFRTVSVFFLAAAVAVFAVAFSPRGPLSAGDVAVVVWPWSPPSRAVEVIARAGGDLVAGARWPFVMMARSSDAAFVDRLYAAGAVVIFRPGVLAGCFREV